MKYTEIKINEYYKAQAAQRYYWIVHIKEIRGENIYTHNSLASCGDFYDSSRPLWISNAENHTFEKATQEETQWLKECGRQDKYIKFEDIKPLAYEIY